MVESGGLGFFTAQQTNGDTALFRTDGTASGTLTLKSGFLPQGSPASLVDFGGALYFSAADIAGKSGLWRSDGTVAGTELVKQIDPALPDGSIAPYYAVDAHGTLFFAAATNGDTELWKSDGTTAGTVQVADINPTGSSFPSQLTVLGSEVIFSAADSSNHAPELWKSDGTAAGTVMLSSVRPAGGNFAANDFLTVNNRVFFTAFNNGYELWVTDGTSAGTTSVTKDLPGVSFDAPSNFVALGDKLLFSATAPGSGPLWVSDGTPSGTFSLGVGELFRGVVMDGAYYFNGFGTSGPQGLWKTDGSIAGTAGLVNGIQFTNTDSIVASNHSVYFLARNASGLPLNYQVWSSDGTAANSAPLFSFTTPPTVEPARTFSAVGGNLLFVEDDGFHGRELFKIDSAADHASILKDLNAAPVLDAPTRPLAVGGRVYFNGQATGALYSSAGISGDSVFLGDIELIGAAARAGGITYFAGASQYTDLPPALWKSNDTLDGTLPVMDFSTAPADLVANDSKVFFVATEVGQAIPQIWVSDGTPQGTVALTSAASDDHFRLLTVSGSGLLFASDHGVWNSDGSAGGTSLVQNIASVNAMKIVNGATIIAAQNSILTLSSDGATVMLLDDPSTGASVTPAAVGANILLATPGKWTYFVGSDAANSIWLCRTDGTLIDTTRVVQIGPVGQNVLAGIYAGPSDVYYATTTAPGFELWRNDGSSATSSSAGTFSGDGAKTLGDFVEAGGIGYFAADTQIAGGSLGTELWHTNGTPIGTGLLNDINPGAASSFPHDFFAINGHPYFLADDGTHGTQLWTAAIPIVPPLAPQNVTAAVVSPYRVALNWHTAVDINRSSYLVERSLASDFSTIDGTYILDLSATSFTDTTADPGARDYYRVTAIGAGGRSSANVSILLPLPAVVGPTLVNTGGHYLQSVANGAPDHHQLDFYSEGVLYRTNGSDAEVIADGIVHADPQRPQPPLPAGFPPSSVLLDSSHGLYEDFDANGVLQMFVTNGKPGGKVQVTFFKDSTDYKNWQEYGTVSAGGVGFFFVEAFNFRSIIQLWKTNGTAAGTVLVKNLAPTRWGYNQLTAVGNRVVFEDGGAVWSSDGTSAGTAKIHSVGNLNGFKTVGEDLQVFQGRAYFTTHFPTNFTSNGAIEYEGQLWSTDGTTAGTRKTPLLMEEHVSADSPTFSLFADDTLYFMADIPNPIAGVAHGPVLWRMTLPPAAAPAAPTGLVAARTANNTIALNWTSHATNDLYVLLERSTTSAFTTIDKSVTLAAGTFSYMDTASTPLVYYYRVRAYNRAGTSGYAYTGHAISGSVFNDTNGNGSKNSGESGVAGITIYLDANNNGRMDAGELSTKTDARQLQFCPLVCREICGARSAAVNIESHVSVRAESLTGGGVGSLGQHLRHHPEGDDFRNCVSRRKWKWQA